MWTCSLSRMAARDHHTPTRAQTLIYVPRFHFHQQLSTANPWQQTGCRTGGWSTLISLRPVSPPLPSPLQDSSRLQLQEEMVAGLTKERKKEKCPIDWHLVRCASFPLDLLSEVQQPAAFRPGSRPRNLSSKWLSQSWFPFSEPF